MIFPPPLRSGDKVGIVAPGKAIKKEDVDYARDLLQSWGLEVVVGDNVFKSSTYLSAADNLRLHDIQAMIDDDSIRAIICARGGYGTTRILDSIDLTPLLGRPKWLVGFSDVTALHLALAKVEIASVHGIMPVLFRKSDAASSIESLKKVLFEGVVHLVAQPSPLNRFGTGYGQLIGGNLSLLVDSLGTSTELDTTNKILVVEEIDEYLYKVDRMITQLSRAGKFQKLQGLVVGHMTEINDTDLPFGHTVPEIILNAVKDCSFPVGFGFPIGHELPNISWMSGQEMQLRVSSNGGSLTAKRNIV